MNIKELLDVLPRAEKAGQNVYLKFEPEILDFTDNEFSFELQFFLNGFSFTLRPEPQSLHFLLQALRFSVFGKGMKVIVWNWKNFITYVLAKTGKHFQVDAAIVDLKVIEAYAGIRQPAPKTLAESLNRLRSLVSEKIWSEIQPIYRKIHLPLLTTVIPSLEVVGVLDSLKQRLVHAYYEINGQDNGRLLCFDAYGAGYVPHTLGQEQKSHLRPRGLDEVFMYFDYRSMEVNVLQWLSKDEVLGEACKADDVYAAIYKMVVGKDCSDREQREKCKKFFLPVIYGQTAKSLAERLKVDLTTAGAIVGRIQELFPTALAWIEAYQKQVQETGHAKDVFGKRRSFEGGKEYRVRNFAVQSPASLICLEKLIQLYFALKDQTDLAYHCHDGYVVYASKDNWKGVFKKAHETLSSESEIASGLRLKVSCRAGRNLDQLRSINLK